MIYAASFTGDEGNPTQSSWGLSFTTDRDPVYIKHNAALDFAGHGPFPDTCYVLLTPA